MQYDIFFSISQTPVDDVTPTEAHMFRNFFDQVKAADRIGYGTAWVAESHLSSEVQKTHRQPVIPHWKGEVGLNTDIFQLAHKVFACTERIEVGSAIMNILCNGGPIAAAERTQAFLALHGLDTDEQRRLHVGFAAGRFDFMNEVYGIKPRNAVEASCWRVVKGLAFREASTIFLRLLRGDTFSSEDIPRSTLHAGLFRTPEQWAEVQALAGGADEIPVEPFFVFQNVRTVPQDVRRDLLTLTIGSHDPAMQDYANTLQPVNVFNLSITQPDIIEATHARMRETYHPQGGDWVRGNMPRTTFVFLNADPRLSPEEQDQAARDEANKALGAYWTALQGTLDPARIAKAADNALIGGPATMARQIQERFHEDDRLMLWFDFFNHDNARVIRNMEDFMAHVVPALEGTTS
jgi:alkanesulfonate monooxygenase SsuD/methylene tetrahydromethanopterin reductase-like flavin-dependent oxidoreductase (luciferase family)